MNTSKKPDLGYYGIRSLFVDKDKNNWVFSSRLRSSHADTYVFTISDHKYNIYDGTYSKSDVIEYIRSFLEENDYLLIGKSRKRKRDLIKAIRRIH